MTPLSFPGVSKKLVLHTKKYFDTPKKILETLHFVFLNLSFVCQNICAGLKLSRPQLIIVYRYNSVMALVLSRCPDRYLEIVY